MLLLTNCTFDGIVYNVERVMEECLAIKPDLVFLWDEAWFGFARFAPTYRQRTAMHCAGVLRARYRGAGYRKRYEAYKAEMEEVDPEDPEVLLSRTLLPDPERVRRWSISIPIRSANIPCTARCRCARSSTNCWR